jgi:hypothetical protein
MIHHQSNNGHLRLERFVELLIRLLLIILKKYLDTLLTEAFKVNDVLSRVSIVQNVRTKMFAYLDKPAILIGSGVLERR